MINFRGNTCDHWQLEQESGKQQRSGTLFTLAALFLSLVLPASAAAGEDGRYQAIVLHEGGGSPKSMALSPKVFILDSRDGHMWTWEQNTWMKDVKGDLQFGTTTTYQGKLKVGSRMGEVVDQVR